MKIVEIADRRVGPGYPCIIVAEAGVNHNGSLTMARRLVDAAALAGADAIKFQTFRAGRLATKNAPKARYQLQTTAVEESQYEMLRRLELPSEAYPELKSYCKEQKILFLSTPFDEESADLLDKLGVGAFKIGSGEITNLPFLDYVAQKRKPIILSTGMSSLGEVESAVDTIREAGNLDLILLHCVSNYPANHADVNLRAMNTMQVAFGVPVGYSDHTEGIELSLAAAALGACVIEKHFTIDKNSPGPDHKASLEPGELATLIKGVRLVESALGDGQKKPVAAELSTAAVARKSLVAARDILAGTVLTEECIAIKRPGTGLPPTMRPYLIGRKARTNIPEDTLFDFRMLE